MASRPLCASAHCASLTMVRLSLAIMAILLVALAAPAQAQTVRVDQIAAEPDLGRLASATSGDTVFRFSAASGIVTRISGTGSRIDTTGTRGRVILECKGGAGATCPAVTVTISAGASTARARPLTNFTVSAISNLVISGESGTSTLTFTAGGIPKNNTGSFYLGADLPIGDNGAGASGPATAAFTVSVSANALSGVARATIFRPISAAVDSHLIFGSIVKPSSGSGVVQVNATTNARVVSGSGAFAFPNPPFARAAYTIGGEGGQTISISVPASFMMSGPGPGITVTLNSFGAMPQMLSSAMGTDGTYLFYVGGSFPFDATTAAGAYSGTFDIIVNYN